MRTIWEMDMYAFSKGTGDKFRLEVIESLLDEEIHEYMNSYGYYWDSYLYDWRFAPVRL